MKLLPLKDKLLVSPLPKATVTSGGIHTLASYNDDRTQWIVEAIGPQVKEVEVGDHILTPMNYGFEVIDDDRRLIPEKDVMMVFGKAKVV
jgi:co-chaperonin GroES (HSP10)